jgi:hypothetical protein
MPTTKVPRPCQRADVDPNIFFSNVTSNVEAARRLCRACPVRLECALEALVNDEEFGTWGGITEIERLTGQFDQVTRTELSVLFDQSIAAAPAA